jgi:2-keto-4-pentenoate hydratase/2-oxohepta-3-ene-1,7-dioic acid hydratase in catechol pathway
MCCFSDVREIGRDVPCTGRLPGPSNVTPNDGLRKRSAQARRWRARAGTGAFLKHGDTVTIEIENVGTHVNPPVQD